MSTPVTPAAPTLLEAASGDLQTLLPLVRAYHQLLVWEIVRQPKVLQWAGAVLDPIIGKSLVLYFHKPAA